MTYFKRFHSYEMDKMEISGNNERLVVKKEGGKNDF